MFIYYSLFIWVVLGSLTKSRLFQMITILLLIIIAGLRFKVGGDWFNYYFIYKFIAANDLTTSLTSTDPAYGLINYLAFQIGYEMWFVNLICASIFYMGLDFLSKNSKNYWIPVLIAFPYLCLSVSMGYTRQSAAIGLGMIAIVHLFKNNKYNFLFWVLMSVLFHKSAILLLIFFPYAFNIKLTGFKNVLYFLSFTIILFVLMNRFSSQDNLYFSEEVSSAGALIRIIIHAPAVVFYIIYRNKFKKIYREKILILDAFLALITIFFFISFLYSTFADRFNLYFYIFDMIVLSSITLFFNRPNYYIYLNGLILFEFILMFVWLNYSPWAQCCWLPYQNYLWSN